MVLLTLGAFAPLSRGIHKYEYRYFIPSNNYDVSLVGVNVNVCEERGNAMEAIILQNCQKMGKYFFILLKHFIIYFLANFKHPRLKISFRIVNLLVLWSHPSSYISLIKYRQFAYIPTHHEMSTTVQKYIFLLTLNEDMSLKTGLKNKIGKHVFQPGTSSQPLWAWRKRWKLSRRWRHSRCNEVWWGRGGTREEWYNTRTGIQIGKVEASGSLCVVWGVSRMYYKEGWQERIWTDVLEEEYG